MRIYYYCALEVRIYLELPSVSFVIKTCPVVPAEYATNTFISK